MRLAKTLAAYDGGPITIVFTDGDVTVTARLHKQPNPLVGSLSWLGTIYGGAEDDLAWRMARDGTFKLLMPDGRDGQANVLDHRVGRFSHVVQIQGNGKPPF
jgi:hypothetical protein